MEIKTKIVIAATAAITLGNLQEVNAQVKIPDGPPHWSLDGNNVTANAKLGTLNRFPLRFITRDTERMRITIDGNVGIGILNPGVKLHVVGGNNARVAGGGFLVAGELTRPNLAIDNDEIMARNNGVASTLFLNDPGGNVVINGSGNNGVGIGTTATGGYRLKIKQSSRRGSGGINIENGTNTNNWELFTSNDGSLQLLCNNVLRGSFNCATGAYSSFPDLFITNIKPMPSMLEKINQLKPASYDIKGGAGQSLGFIAKEVRQVFPSLVSMNVDKERGIDGYMIDYSGFGVIAIKGIQELQQTINQQQQTINTLTDRIAKLEAANSSGSNTHLGATNIIGVSLEQNHPNPFNQTTTFRYTIPKGTLAQIHVYDVATGKRVKTLTAPDSGRIQMNGYELQPGNYIYTLEVNGKIAASRQLIIEK